MSEAPDHNSPTVRRLVQGELNDFYMKRYASEERFLPRNGEKARCVFCYGVSEVKGGEVVGCMDIYDPWTALADLSKEGGVVPMTHFTDFATPSFGLRDAGLYHTGKEVQIPIEYFTGNIKGLPLYLANGYVMPSVRGRGLGRAMIEGAIEAHQNRCLEDGRNICFWGITDRAPIFKIARKLNGRVLFSDKGDDETCSPAGPVFRRVCLSNVNSHAAAHLEEITFIDRFDVYKTDDESVAISLVGKQAVAVSMRETSNRGRLPQNPSFLPEQFVTMVNPEFGYPLNQLASLLFTRQALWENFVMLPGDPWKNAQPITDDVVESMIDPHAPTNLSQEVVFLIRP